ncbi:hydroxysteroid 11-beta-dehydrogenase 1-like protein isoform X2 [Panthera leo]|uniref:hydroxysteroid 11-beta-dehydrogenase 1-like protein isoform X2 n=1 Tax=Panthera leo TaxID=9689 RepID=UPI001C69D0FD|nr:hydroxysteroid 11-beta-dehydrogenase 1-like protein isoform X2 [Panthera leo]
MKVLLFTGLGALFFSYYWDDNFDPASLQGARVLLTGASAGVGEELAYHYARLGSHLVLTAHTEALLQKVVGNCRKLGAPKVFYIAADMASPEVPERVVQFALDKLGGLDYLVLNHLGATPAGSRSRSVQATRWLMQVNFLSYVQLTSLALPSLTDSKGSLVVVSSLLGAHILLPPVLGSQVRPGRLLRLSAAGARRAGRERGHHHVCPGPPGSRLPRRGSQTRKLRLREVMRLSPRPWPCETGHTTPEPPWEPYPSPTWILCSPDVFFPLSFGAFPYCCPKQGTALKLSTC